ncbi:MAG: ABC transporter substrate-binding protein [Clostridia bacterium]|nr:ABC transporter substrate-binding protein [Clostridia bacterium]MDD4386844.1 ABC transporter substrate-binding protein [Clostridia bacterium]
MNPQIINSHKYKKISRNDKDKKDKKFSKNIKSGRYKKSAYSYFNNSKKIRKSDIKRKRKNSIFLLLLKVACCILIIISIGYVSKYIVNLENNPILSVFKNNDNDIKLVANYDFKIGVNNLDNKNNILINELYKYSYRTLITIDEQYKIIYNLVNRITKIDDLTYEIEIKDASDISDIIYTIEKLKNNNDNRYYKYLSNISSATMKDNNIIKIVLNNPNAYIIYSLDFKIEQKDINVEKQNYYNNIYNFSNNSNNISFVRNDEIGRDIMKSITFTNYLDSDNLVGDFRNNLIDMFLTSSEEDMRLVGKHEYSIKKYRDGETYFLFGNKNSKIFSLKEVRKAIAYSLNRNEITKQISPTFTEVIDIPYIYSAIGYKYDIYGAENALIAESWNKSSGIYNKKIDGNSVNLELTLLVNSEDSIKVNIAESVKQMLGNTGIRINIQKLKSEEIILRIKNGDYDLILTSVYINNNPDTSYINDYININENINEAINRVNTSSVDELSNNVQNLQNVISNEIACIGIAAKNINIVYQKFITGFEDISYMNVFKDIDKIGKIIQ